MKTSYETTAFAASLTVCIVPEVIPKTAVDYWTKS